jgi:hypothetical protein
MRERLDTVFLLSGLAAFVQAHKSCAIGNFEILAGRQDQKSRIFCGSFVSQKTSVPLRKDVAHGNG